MNGTSNTLNLGVLFVFYSILFCNISKIKNSVSSRNANVIVHTKSSFGLKPNIVGSKIFNTTFSLKYRYIVGTMQAPSQHLRGCGKSGTYEQTNLAFSY